MTTPPATAPALTEQQARALATRDTSVALSAGAGCGKTFVLSERFLSHLEPGVAAAADGGGPLDLSEIVAFTYTERAAREMRDRVRRKCAQRLDTAAEEHVPHWLGLLRSLDRARISTVHSFCQSLLRGHAVAAGIDPRFTVFDPAQADAVLRELVDDVLRDRLAANDAATIHLVKTYGLQGTQEHVLELAEQRDFPAAEKLPAWTVESLLATWPEWVLPVRRERVAEIVRSPDFAGLRAATESPQCPDAKYQPQWNTIRAMLPKITAMHATDALPIAELATLAAALKLQGQTVHSRWPLRDEYDVYSSFAKSVRSEIDDALRWLRDDPVAWREAATLGLELLDVSLEVRRRYDDEKRSLGTLDFDDLIRLAHQLLTDPRHETVRRRLAERTRMLLVDEAQDSNPRQIELIEALCDAQPHAGKLFFVGDAKQSIYRFLGAAPHVFQNLRSALPAAGQIPLSVNFRSQPAILSFVNGLFAEAFPEYEPLVPQRAQLSPTPAVEFLWSQSDNDHQPSVDTCRAAEADWIARRLRQLLDSPLPLLPQESTGEATLRTVRPGDIAILFRALSDVAHYEAALRTYDIPYYLVGGKAFYSQQEVFDVSNLLRTIDSPCDEASLLGVLRSPFFSLADETLFWLVRERGRLAAFLHPGPLPEPLAAEQRSAAQFARDVLSELRSVKDRLSIAGLLELAIARTGYDAALLAEFLGARKLANLRKLIDKARTFDHHGGATLAEFVSYLTETEARQPDEALAATQAENADVVRLMTIHQAKGLEFPVVVVADVGRQDHGGRTEYVVDPAWGPLAGIPRRENSAPRLPLDFYRESQTAEELAERTRLFYVATTRAADYLILSGHAQSLNKDRSTWGRLLRERCNLDTGRWLGDEAARDPPPVRVTTTAPQAEPPRSTTSRPKLNRVLADVAKVSPRDVIVSPHVGPIAVDPAARTWWSFSRLTGELHASPPPRTVDDADDAAAPPRVDPLGLGTLVHAALAEIDFSQPGDVAALVTRLAAQHVAPGAPEIERAITLIQRFVESPRAHSLAQAKQLHREIEFLLPWPATDGAPAARLHGFIDCLYEDAAGAWHVLDFKTNAITKQQVAQTAAAYEMQLYLYATAAQQALGARPQHLTLHFLAPEQEHEFPWPPPAERRLQDWLTTALRQPNK